MASGQRFLELADVALGAEKAGADEEKSQISSAGDGAPEKKMSAVLHPGETRLVFCAAERC